MVRESFDIHFIIEKFPAILSALPVTLEITAVTLVLGWLLGLLVAWGKVSGSGWLNSLPTRRSAGWGTTWNSAKLRGKTRIKRWPPARWTACGAALR